MDEKTQDIARKLKAALVQDERMGATQWLVDAAIAAGAFGFGVLQMTLSLDLFLPDHFTRMMLGIQSVAPSGLAILGIALTCTPLIVRRKLPWPTFAACVAFWLLFANMLQVSTLSLAGPLVALFTVAYERGRGESAVAAVIMLAAVLASPLLVSVQSPFDSLILLQNAILTAAVALAGYAFNARGRLVQEAEARAEQAERLQVAERLRAEEAERAGHVEAARRVESERVRIAREVHDITAHSLSAVSIQAAAAERLIDADPDAAKQAIGEVRVTAKSALNDMRSMVGVLRSGEAAETEPTAGTERMQSLVDYLEGAGVACDLFMYGYDRKRVPAHVDVALFGIAREACTNIVRHSGATKATIALREVEGGIVLFVCDNGNGMPDGSSEAGGGSGAPSSSGPSGGHGIEGMRERVSLLDGTFEVTPSPDGGVCVSAMIPDSWKEASR